MKKKKGFQEEYKGQDFATISDRISNKYKNRDFDKLEQNAFDAEMKELIKHQTIAQERVNAQEQRKFEFGSTNPTFKLGQNLNDPNSIQPLGATSMNPLGIPVRGLNDPSAADLQRVQDSQVIRNDRQTQDLSINAGVPAELGRNLNANPRNNPIDFINTGVGGQFDIPARELGDLSTGVPSQRKSGSFLDKVKTALSNDYAPALIGQGINTAINAGMLLGGADKEAPNYNPNEQRVERLMADRNIDNAAQRNAILGQQNAARANVRNTGGSGNSQNALLSGLDSNFAKALANSDLQQQQTNNQYKGEFANVLNSLGESRKNADNQADIINAQNKGRWESELSKLGMSVGDSAKFLTKMRANKTSNEVMTNILNLKYKSFGLNPETMANIVSGKGSEGELLILKNAISSNPELETFTKFLKDNE